MGRTDSELTVVGLASPESLGPRGHPAVADIRIRRGAGYTQMVSPRSGEACDGFIADQTVGAGCGQRTSGAVARRDRVARHNRLLAATGPYPHLPYGPTGVTR